MKRVLTIQDFSCLGRCSLTVAIPTISAAGLECVAIPTAILSNHTAFKEWTYKDLTDEMLPIVEKWRGYKNSFDSIYTGYLGTEQIPLVEKIIEELRTPSTNILIDPAMADNGSFYPGFQKEHIAKMKELISYADIIVPNLTEACLLSDIPYPNKEIGLDKEFYSLLLASLTKLGPRKIVLSGQTFKPNEISDIVYENGDIKIYSTPLYPGRFHGTGDLFASSLVGALGNGFSLFEATRIAHDYVHEAIRLSNEVKEDGLLYGASFEGAIPLYIHELGKDVR